MQVEQKRLCGVCGAESPQDAGSCWQCHASFSTQQSPLPPAPGTVVRGPVGPPPLPAPEPKRFSPSATIRVMVGLVAAAAGYLGVQMILGGGPELPDSIAGVERVENSVAEDFEKDMIEEGERIGIDVAAGVYGKPTSPDFVVLLVDAAAIETTDQLFDNLMDGFAQAGATVGSDRASGERAGVEFRCAEANAPVVSAAACMWREDDNVGIVLDVDGDVRSAKRLLWETHDAVLA